ncbi:MAG: hypothetical protein AAGB22_01720 [Bacteroidota bacterium]
MKDNLDQQFREAVDRWEAEAAPMTWSSEATWEDLEAALHPKKKRRALWWWTGAAAAVALLVGLFWWTNGPEQTHRVADRLLVAKTGSDTLAAEAQQDVKPALSKEAPSSDSLLPRPAPKPVLEQALLAQTQPATFPEAPADTMPVEATAPLTVPSGLPPAVDSLPQLAQVPSDAPEEALPTIPTVERDTQARLPIPEEATGFSLAGGIRLPVAIASGNASASAPKPGKGHKRNRRSWRLRLGRKAVADANPLLADPGAQSLRKNL